jgi:hypothetical protein
MKLELTWMSIWRREPEVVNECGVSGGTITTSPALAVSRLSPATNSASPSRTMKISFVGMLVQSRPAARRGVDEDH